MTITGSTYLTFWPVLAFVFGMGIFLGAGLALYLFSRPVPEGIGEADCGEGGRP